MNHQLIYAGAAYNSDGVRLYPKTTSGWGRALCSCGWTSDEVEYGRTRKELHKEHKAEREEQEQLKLEAEQEELRTALWSLPPEPETTNDASREDAVEDMMFDSSAVDRLLAAIEDTCPLVGPEPETAPGQDEAPVSEPVNPTGYPVQWPEGVAKLFFRALAKDGAKILAEVYGLTRSCNESKLELSINGISDTAWELALELPNIFVAANTALKAWRKTSPGYKRFSLKTPEGRRDAFAAEQRFLRDFCSGFAGTFSPDAISQEGTRAGIRYGNGDAEDLL